MRSGMTEKENKPHVFTAQKTPFKVKMEWKHGQVVGGIWIEKEHAYQRFTKPLPVKLGDTFKALPGMGLILNGKIVPMIFGKKRKVPVQIAWAPKRLRVALYPEFDDTRWSDEKKRVVKCKPMRYWVAMDVRGYWLGTGDTAQDALRSLLQQLHMSERLCREERDKGLRVIRWHCERKPGSRKETRECEQKALKNGMILEGIDWRQSTFAKEFKETRV